MIKLNITNEQNIITITAKLDNDNLNNPSVKPKKNMLKNNLFICY